MAELTKAQIERAHKAWCDVNAWPCDEVTPQAWKVITAVAPFLQLPWSWPTAKEFETFYGRLNNYGGTKVNRQVMEQTLQGFINDRNWQLIPKPDSRREKIIEILKAPTSHSVLPVFPEDARIYADRILAALDEVK